VHGPRYAIKKGKTPVLTPDEARLLLDSIPLVKTITRRDGSTIEKPNLVGLRDRALLAVMVYSFARVSAVVGMDVDDYYQQGKRWWLRLHEKGGKHHEVPVHHKAEEYLDAYIAAAGIKSDKDTPLWRCVTEERSIGDGRLTRIDVYRMIKRRCRQAELGAAANCHTFRATGITAYLLNGGSLENAQAIAAHESPARRSSMISSVTVAVPSTATATRVAERRCGSNLAKSAGVIWPPSRAERGDGGDNNVRMLP
jgi:integrase/recombinase XerD